MTLLSIVQSVCGELAFPAPSSVVSSSIPQAPPLFALARKAVEEISAKKDWPHLWKVYTFDTVDGQDAYPLPSDFDKLLSDTAYDATEDYRLRGGVSPRDFQFYSIHGGTPSAKRFIINGYPRQLRLTPTPDSVTTVSLMYKTNRIVVGSDSTEKTTFSADDDVPKIGSRLVKLELAWRYLRQRKLDYAEEMADSERAIEKAYGDALSQPIVLIGGNLRFSECDWVTDGYVSDRNYGP